MILAEHLHELLLQHETVIIPGFGAFISNYKPAEINAENNEIIPPSKEILFNSKIRNNDGVLVDFVARVESVSHFDALKIIEKERENIIYQLDKGEQITLENIGVLFRNENKEIDFVSQVEENLLLDSFGLGSVSFNEEESEKAENTGNDKPKEPEEISDPDETINEEITVESEVENIIDKNEKVISSVSIDEKTQEEKSEDAQLKEENFGKDKIVEFEPVAEEFRVKNQPEETKKKQGWLWFLLIFIPLILAGFYLAKNKFFSDDSYEIVTHEEEVGSKAKPVESIAGTDSVVNDTAPNLPIDTVGQTLAGNIGNEMTEPEKPRFYLVGGSFKEKENADKFMAQFDAEGYEPFLLGKRGNFFIVAIGTYSTERQAVIAKDTFMEKNPGSGIWVFEDEP